MMSGKAKPLRGRDWKYSQPIHPR